MIDELAIYLHALSAEQTSRRIELEKSVAGPVGDFYANGQLDVVAIDLPALEIGSGTNLARYERNQGQVGHGDDHRRRVVGQRKTWCGDMNHDGLFNISDSATRLEAGLFKTAGDASLEQRDGNGGSRFNSGD